MIKDSRENDKTQAAALAETVGMPHRDTSAEATMLSDRQSRVLYLEDALRSGNSQTMALALNTIVQARGIMQVAKDAGVVPSTFQELLIEPSSRTNALQLGDLIRRLIGRLADVPTAPLSSKTIKSRRVRDKTAGLGEG